MKWFWWAHGDSGSRSFWLLGSWAAVLLCYRVPIPRVTPIETGVQRPLESLSMIALLLPVVVLTRQLVTRTGWLTLTSPRPIRGLRVLLATVHLGLGATMVVFVSWLGSPTSPTRLFATWAALTGIAQLGQLKGSIGALIAPALFMGLFSTRGVVPWDLNFVYNQAVPARHSLAVGLLLLLLGTLAYAMRGHQESTSTHR